MSPDFTCWRGRTATSASSPPDVATTVTERAAEPSPIAARPALMVADLTAEVTTLTWRAPGPPPPPPGRAPGPPAGRPAAAVSCTLGPKGRIMPAFANVSGAPGTRKSQPMAATSRMTRQARICRINENLDCASAKSALQWGSDRVAGPGRGRHYNAVTSKKDAIDASVSSRFPHPAARPIRSRSRRKWRYRERRPSQAPVQAPLR